MNTLATYGARVFFFFQMQRSLVIVLKQRNATVSHFENKRLSIILQVHATSKKKQNNLTKHKLKRLSLSTNRLCSFPFIDAPKGAKQNNAMRGSNR